MSTIDPGKLKVVELRAELTNRGLDIKGNKPVLVQRLKEAIEKETQSLLPDTSIADTSTEECNTSQDTNDEDVDKIDKEDSQDALPDASPKPDEPMESAFDNDNVISESMDTAEAKVMDENLEQENPDLEPPQETPESNVETAEEQAVDKPSEESDNKQSEHQKGEKRRRSSPSPQRSQRRRSRTPIKEDEPEIDNEKVSLSWFDSDLHLQIDKENLLSAKPINEGAFGYSWAGARATHGIKSGKVFYEVKITEELKWEDIIKELDKRREAQKLDRRDKRRNDRKDRDTGRRGYRSEKSDAKSESKDKPAEDKPAEDKPVEDNTAEDKPAEDKPVEDKLTEDIPTEDKPTEEVETTDAKPEENNTDEHLNEDKSEEIKNNVDTEEHKSEEAAADKQEISDAPAKIENGNSETQNEKTESMDVDPPAPEIEIKGHVFRCGWSVSTVSLQLGETSYSYGFDSQGHFVTESEFKDYGVAFAVGDVIGAYANIDDEKVELVFTVNGVSQGSAISIVRSELPEEFILFPHVLTRNCAFELNLGNREEPWFPNPDELSDYAHIQACEDKFKGPSRPATRAECEIVMMCGLPGSGKTTWVKEFVKENSDKLYTVIGITHLVEKMTVNGKSFKDVVKNRWNVVLDRLMKCINILVDKAGVRRRNFIIDQTNVFPSAQRRKMRLFEGFKRRAVIVVVNDEEQAKRRAQQETQDGKDVPDSALLEMKANMVLPKTGDWLEEVKYVELDEEEAKTVVEKYNSEGKAAGFGGFNRRGGYKDRGPYRWNRNTSRRDYRDNYRDRSYQNNRYRGPPGNYSDRRSGSGNWNRDYRDNRGPPRDMRNNRSGGGGHHDRSGPRDRNQGGGGGYRNQRPQGGRNQGSGWPNAWEGSQAWGGAQGAYQNWGQGNWSGQGQFKGTYGQGGYNQGGYGNWNYYGQYTNNWPVNK